MLVMLVLSIFLLFLSDNNANKSATAFCSYQDIIKDNGNPFTSVSKASASAVAILTAEYASLH